MSMKAERRQRQRQELKTIESHLHPIPDKLNDCEILHEHRASMIRFSAWKDNNPVNNKYLSYSRYTVLMEPHFYNNELSHLKWLTV